MYRSTMTTPIGDITLVGYDDALHAVLFAGHDVREVPDVPEGDGPVLDAARQQLGEYFAGERQQFDLPLELRGTPFQVRAWNALVSIAFGTTVSYGEQARRLGGAGHARAVGAANGRNPLPIVLPCHRVVGANGHLTGFGGGIENKAWLLDHEQQVLATG